MIFPNTSAGPMNMNEKGRAASASLHDSMRPNMRQYTKDARKVRQSGICMQEKEEGEITLHTESKENDNSNCLIGHDILSSIC